MTNETHFSQLVLLLVSISFVFRTSTKQLEKDYFLLLKEVATIQPTVGGICQCVVKLEYGRRVGVARGKVADQHRSQLAAAS